MNNLVVNLLFALVWAFFFGDFSLLTLSSGLVLGYGVLWLLQPLTGGPSGYFLRVWYWFKLIVMFHYELVVSSLEVLWDILTPTHRARPAIIEMPLDVKSDAGILLVTNLISLTPGTLSLDVSADRKTLSLHAMFADDPDAVCRQLKQGMEKWVIDAVERS
ncbi:Na+/H+ antiporter subunit E [Aestuariivita sp.]|jgi:multicomponent Na+:H+ antiporter subunit E|uniref:Na+/H+ antiporter subunit E n=1 Tax=Aestuariivita sp. TaxID=1872407 RepID=UPI00216E91A8|nr:Na+/H+ antiporter subunit E [Aestuariivita sp.]MCE8006441.1 Na+/H+ antiporter subunit E [Aestuariivita sp.]